MFCWYNYAPEGCLPCALAMEQKVNPGGNILLSCSFYSIYFLGLKFLLEQLTTNIVLISEEESLEGREGWDLAPASLSLNKIVDKSICSNYAGK